MNKSTACRCQRSAVECLIEDKKLKKGHNSEKNAFRIVSLDSMNCSLDSEHIFCNSLLILNFSHFPKMARTYFFLPTPTFPSFANPKWTMTYQSLYVNKRCGQYDVKYSVGATALTIHVGSGNSS